MNLMSNSKSEIIEPNDLILIVSWYIKFKKKLFNSLPNSKLI